jgi:hypothetical protein
VEKQTMTDLEMAQQRRHNKIAQETNNRIKLTLTLRQFVSGILLLIFALSFVGRATSGRFWFDVGTRNEVERLSREVTRKDIEIDHLGRKLNYKAETLLIFQGIALDKPNFLERSRTSNPNRTEPFEFVKWILPDEFVAFMFRNESFKCLEWVMSQENWYSCLNEKTYNRLVEWKPHNLDRNFALDVFNDMPEQSKAAIARLADSVRANGATATLLHLKKEKAGNDKRSVKNLYDPIIKFNL